MRKIAITGIRKAAESVGNYLKNKSLRGVARANRIGQKGVDATANLVRKAARASDALDNATLGPIGKATRDASAAVIKKTRHTRPRARETMGQINRRKGIVNKKYTPSENYVENGKMDQAMNIWKNQGMGKIGNKPKDMGDFRNRMRGNNINFRDESARPQYMHELPNQNPRDNIGMMRKAPKQPAFDRSKLSYDEIKPMGRSGPRYTNKQVQAGRKVGLGLAAGYGASEYYKSKKANR